MDDFPVGNPKYSRIKATYCEPPVRQAHPLPDQNEPIDNPWHDILVVVIGIGVIVAMWLLAINWPLS